MAGEGETKRKAGIPIDFDKLLGKEDEPLPELQIVGAAEKSKPQAEVASKDEEVDAQFDSYIRKLSDKDLHEKIVRNKNLLGTNLPDGGYKLKVSLRKCEAELELRNLQKDDHKCKRVKTLPDEPTCKGAINDLTHTEALPSKSASEFSLLFRSKMENDNATNCFREELQSLNRSDHKNIRKHPPFSVQIKQKKDFSSRQAPFKSPSNLSVNINSQKQTNGEQQGVHAYNTSPHPDKDASCCLTKKESGARSPLPLNSRRSNRRTVVLDLVDEELEVNVVDKADQEDQSSQKTHIYYPSRNDPAAIELCYSDMECLAPESFLSSPIMNFYIWYLQNPTSPSIRRQHDYHIFNTYFYEKLKQDVLTKTDKEASFRKFRRWWRGVKIFEKAYIFLPIHENVHWSLVIICMPSKDESGQKDESWPIILHLDSLGLHNSRSIFSSVKSFLLEEWNYIRQEEMLPEPPIANNIWKRLPRRIVEKVIEVPQQKNEYDCGIFVLYFMERFIEEAPERLKKQDLEMFGRQWFKPQEASSLRRKIHNLLKEEFKNNASEDTNEGDS